MIKRYCNPEITEIWSDENKFSCWQEVELAFIRARAHLGVHRLDLPGEIDRYLLEVPVDITMIDEIEKTTNHDLNAFVEERRRHLPIDLQPYFHSGNTSYDTEEPAFALMLGKSYDLVVEEFSRLQEELYLLAMKHQYTIMFARTHGQEAELQTFGKRCLSQLQCVNAHVPHLRVARESINYSKFSGAVGNYTTITADEEKATLEFLGLKPFYGATQIMPREVYAPLADALARLCLTICKIGLDIRLAGRSGRPLCHEPFGKGQMGSSAMPHKKNPIFTENLEGMSRLAKAAASAIRDNIPTWEERAIEQSCVERVAWPDLFHVTVFALKRLTRVIRDLVVYPENMMLEVKESGGLYASNAVKELLKKAGEPFGLTAEDAYRIVQLAAFNVADERRRQIVYSTPKHWRDMDRVFDVIQPLEHSALPQFREIIGNGHLSISPQLAADEQTVSRWNAALCKVFQKSKDLDWNGLFEPSQVIQHESAIYDAVRVEPLG
ncbi:MAG: adenylosuccinate lyase [Patescibacteria group bacterium]|mgnify:CR=1 FL=1